MKAERELKMTVICKDCEFQYGAWRGRCPACGTATPVKVVEQFNAPRVTVGRPVKRERPRRENECIFCRRRGAKEKCPHCNEPIHKNCVGLHEDVCVPFQDDLREASAQLS